MRLIGICACSLVTVMLAGGCDGSTSTRGSPPAAAGATEPATAAPPGSSVSGERRLPRTVGPPRRLEPGRYLSPEGFAPEMSVAVPEGWYGGGSASGWGVGQGHDEVKEEFLDAEIHVDVLRMPFGAALEAFGAVEGLYQRENPRSTEIDGHRAVTYYASPVGDQVLLEEAFGLRIDISSGEGRQTFVQFDDDTTVFIRGQVIDDAATPAFEAALSSLEFS